jgi:hypothetical protein
VQDDDDELNGLSPTSMWSRTRRKDPFKDEDEEEEKEEKEEEDDDEEEEEEEDNKHITNARDKGKLTLPLIHVDTARVVPPPQGMERNTGTCTGGGVPIDSLSSKNLVINLLHRENVKVSTKDLPGEWDHHIPKVREGRHQSGSLARRSFSRILPRVLGN